MDSGAGPATRRAAHDRTSTDASATVGDMTKPDANFEDEDPNKRQAQEGVGATVVGGVADGFARAHEYLNGYHFPPKYSWREILIHACIDFWAFYNTGFGFFLTIYALFVVGWGGMLFLLLCGAGPAMCMQSNGLYDCNAIDSPRRIWVEIDSQILTALFCVTGFGLAPWRIRDLVLLLKYRMRKDTKALRELAGVHRGWFRLPGSENLPVHLGPKNIEETDIQYPVESVPYPLETIPDAPPTGIRAPPTKMWKLDLVVWLNIVHTLLQVVLSTFMWAFNRYDRPSWATGLFVCLGCIVAIVAGFYMGKEGKYVKTIEGVPLTKRDRAKLAKDEELGITHHNNYQDKDPAELERKKKKKEKEDTEKEKKSSSHSEKSR